MSNHILTGLYLRGLIDGSLLGALVICAIHTTTGVELAVTLVFGVAMLAVALGNIHRAMNEDETLRQLTETRAPISTETVTEDDDWGNE